MSIIVLVTISLAYLSIIFIGAYASERYEKFRVYLSNSSLVYALSLGVYCTAWTFYGSIGRAATTGLSFLGVYLGPTLITPLWLFVLKKIVRISKHLRITSIADFISSRYGKSTTLGVLVSILCLLIVIPYISIQLKALEFSFNFLHYGTTVPQENWTSKPFYQDPSMLFVLIFAGFAIFFGTRKLDLSEKHPGLVSVVALESIIKLVCFLVGAITIVYVVFGGIEDIFTQFHEKYDITALAILTDNGMDYQSWFWVLLLSAFAFILLPRQFHMAVVENNSVRHLKKATWVTPLYLFLISIFVIPVAFAGRIFLSDTVEVDTYFLNIPIEKGFWVVAVVVFIGGLAAISGMIITSMISLSIMISNNIFLPILLMVKKQFDYFLGDLNIRLLQLRRVLIIFVMVLSFGFYKGFSINYSLVSVGLMSFAGIAQLAPLVLLGLYWKGATAKAAIAGFCTGVTIWAFTLPFANMAELGIVSPSILTNGLFGISFLRPTALLGIEGMSTIAHGSFWSLSSNLLVMVVVSFYTDRSPLEIAQSDIFLNPQKYYKTSISNRPTIEREAVFVDLRKTLVEILGKKKVDSLLNKYFLDNKIDNELEYADSRLIDYIENYLSGSIGTASANIVLNNLVQQKPIDTDELIVLLDQTYQVYEYSQLLEAKSTELSITSNELKTANDQLQQLDVMKNEFISNVTHELRTPITSIRSIAGILSTYEVTDAEKEKFLKIINEESERVSNLIDQVLDLRKIEAKPQVIYSTFDLKDLIERIVLGFSEMKNNRIITINGSSLSSCTDLDKLQQILVNLLSNAIKFTDKEGGAIRIDWIQNKDDIVITIKDNGIGIGKENHTLIFDRFYQVKSGNINKSRGSGLGLSFCRTLAESLDGTLILNSELGKGSSFILTIKNQESQNKY